MITIPIDLNERSYEIDVDNNSLERTGTAIASLGNVSRVILVVDNNVEPLYCDRVANSIVRRGIDLDVIVIPAGEESKSIDVAYTLWEKFVEAGADRQSVAVALGGGVVGDLTGFVAATYVRGIRFFQIPTTLLAQVDSSVGGKTAIDLPQGKNLVGAFYQPSGVLIDPTTLATLPADQYQSGLGEVLKYGTSLDKTFFEILEQNIDRINTRSPSILAKTVAHCCRLKARIVAEDEKETTGKRAVLNYGHTFGHAIETALGYGTIPHGYGVSIGSILAAKLAARLGKLGDERFELINDEWIERQISLTHSLRLPAYFSDIGRSYNDSPTTTPKHLIELMKSDKKATFGKLNLILPTNLGECVLSKGIDEQDVLAVLN